MKSTIPGDLLERFVLEDIEREAKDYALCNGIIFRVKTSTNDDIVELAPITVFPSPFPRECFQLAKDIQEDVNLLMHRVACDYGFLASALESTIQVEPFTQNLFDVHTKVLKEGTAQPMSFGLLRADYMLHANEENDRANEPQLKQVEVNVIAAGFAIMGPKLSRFHRHTMSKYGHPIDLERLPENMCDVNFAQAFVDAWKTYDNPLAVILVVVEDRTINLSDQRSMDFAITQARPDIRVIRRNFKQLQESVSLKGNQRLFIDHDYEVGLVYFRYGYDPSHYLSEDHWNLRVKIEKSRALKCPSIQYQLAGVKKVQQILCDKRTLDKFLDSRASERMSKTFAGMWSLGHGERGDAAIDMIMTNPHNYVIKPQREGGGNNIYGQDINAFFDKVTSDQREAYIAMERLKPPVLENMLVSPKNLPQPTNGLFHQIDSELGIFGSILGDATDIVFNRTAGHVLRSKLVQFNEGGVSSGQGVIDSPYLY